MYIEIEAYLYNLKEREREEMEIWVQNLCAVKLDLFILIYIINK